MSSSAELENPVCIVGCYVLDLYCARKCDPLNRRMQYTGPTGRDCFAQAHKDGWVTGGSLAYCPKCAAGTKTQKAERLTP
jgi:hypothetical protein